MMKKGPAGNLDANFFTSGLQIFFLQTCIAEDSLLSGIPIHLLGFVQLNFRTLSD